MRWRAKALLQQVLSRVPAGERMNLLFQRHVTRTLPISDEKLASMVDHAREHLRAVEPLLPRPLAEATFYEFGAGWELSLALALYSLGVENQLLIDIRPLTRADLVNDVIARLGAIELSPEPPRRPRQLLPEPPEFFAALEEAYGISYRAPLDARKTGLPEGSVDCITSTNTLEHIAGEDLPAIFGECARLLRKGGVASFLIDYQDHYSYFDPALSPYNFLRYSDRAWRRYNPSLHYQNRLRHRDFVELLGAAGLEILAVREKGGSEGDLELLSGQPLDPRFRGYSLRELAVRDAWVTARKK